MSDRLRHAVLYSGMSYLALVTSNYGKKGWYDTCLGHYYLALTKW